MPHYEKMLVSNASLLVSYLEAFQLTRKAVYRAAATGILDYLLTTLFSLPPRAVLRQPGRRRTLLPDRPGRPATKLRPPPVDRTFYAGWNALAADALIQAANVLGSSAYRRLGADILEKLWHGSWTSAGGLAPPRAGELSDAAPILSDQV